MINDMNPHLPESKCSFFPLLRGNFTYFIENQYLFFCAKPVIADVIDEWLIATKDKYEKGTPITSFLSSRYSSTVRIFYAIYWLNYNICKLSTFSAPVFSIYCVSIMFAAPDTHQDLGITKGKRDR